MTEDEMKEIAERLKRIETARGKRASLQDKLDELNDFIKHNAPATTVQIKVSGRDSRGYGQNFDHWLPGGILQQLLINEITDCDRRIVALGGTP